MILSLTSYGLSLYLPAIKAQALSLSNHSNTIYQGGTVLLLGWVTIDSLQFAWFANIFYLLSLFFTQYSKAACVIAIFLSLTTFIYYPLSQLLIGYYLWILSLMIFLPVATYNTEVYKYQRHRQLNFY